MTNWTENFQIILRFNTVTKVLNQICGLGKQKLD